MWPNSILNHAPGRLPPSNYRRCVVFSAFGKKSALPGHCEHRLVYDPGSPAGALLHRPRKCERVR